LADDYICGSDGNIAVVLGLDIEYHSRSKRATVSVWRPRMSTNKEGEEGTQIFEVVSEREADVRSYHHLSNDYEISSPRDIADYSI